MTNTNTNNAGDSCIADEPVDKYLDNRLTHQQQRFCDLYLTHFNAYKAAVETGYSENTARKGALLHVPKIQRYLSEVMNRRSQRLEITHDMLLREYSKIAFANMGNYYNENATLKDMTELTVDEKAAIRDYSLQDFAAADGSYAGSRARIKLHNKMAALDRIAKHVGFFGVAGVKPAAGYQVASIDYQDNAAESRVDGINDTKVGHKRDACASALGALGTIAADETVVVVDKGIDNLPMDYPVEDFELEGIELKTLVALEGLDISLESGVESIELEEEVAVAVAVAVAVGNARNLADETVEKFLTISPLVGSQKLKFKSQKTC